MTPADILSELDDHGFSDDSTTRKLGMLNDTYEDVCSREPWPFLEKEATLTFDGTTAVPTNLPPDFSKLLGLQDPTNNVSVTYERWEVVKKRYAATIATANIGNPETYYFVAGKLRVYPVPSATQTLSLEYVSWPPLLTQGGLETDILIPPRHHRVLTLGTLFKLYSMEDDPELAQVFLTQYEDRINKMREDLIRVQYDSPDHIYVTDVDYFDDNPWMTY